MTSNSYWLLAQLLKPTLGSSDTPSDPARMLFGLRRAHEVLVKRLSRQNAARPQPVTASRSPFRGAPVLRSATHPALALVLTIGAMAASCAPEKARVNDNVSGPGPFEGYAIVMKLPAQNQAPATGAAAPSTNGRPSLHVCFQFAQGSTLSAERNEYDCRFYEYFERAGKWSMSSEVFNEKGPGAGAAGTCSFGGAPSGAQLPFTCKRIAADKSISSCSVFNEFILDAGRQGASFATVNNTGVTPTITPAAPNAASLAGVPLPAPSEVAIVKGRCGEATTTASGLSPTLQFIMPTADQLVAAQGAAPAGAAAGAASGMVKFKASQATPLKYATGQSGDMTEGSQKCAVAAGAVVTGKPVGGGTPTPDSTKHYALTNVTVEPKPTGCTLLDDTTKPIYLFSPHWTVTP